jgi:2-oxoglutarate dehydrogenase E2 component (dihydrolipoamide succinyltransferase)
MKIDIIMPKMGESITEGTIIKWHKSPGDTVKKDEIIFEISTDKVDTEVPSPAEGIITEILYREQETVEVGTVVARMSSSQEDYFAEKSDEESIIDEGSMHDIVAKHAAEEQEPIHKAAMKKEAGKGHRAHKFFSPLVLGIAQKENVTMDELGNIEGTGIGGRVTKKDILTYVEMRAESIGEEAPSASSKQGSIDRIPMDNLRQQIMKHMINSRDTSVHVSEVVEVDMTAIAKIIKDKKSLVYKKDEVKLTYMAFISYAVVKALREFPLLNSSIEGKEILKKNFINLGIAVALEPDGLIVPNIKNAQDKNLIGLAKSISDVAEKARSKKLVLDDISNGTFTITNFGIFGTLHGTPIINQPEVAILGVGAVVKRPVVIETGETDSIAIKSMMYLTLSHDHRIIDGLQGGRFLGTVKQILENFSESLLL